MPTVQDLKDQLSEAGVEYDSKAKKSDLEKLTSESSVEVLPTKGSDPAPDSLQVAVAALEGLASGTILDNQLLVPGKIQRYAQDALDQING